MKNSAREFYSKNAENQAENYTDEDLAQEFLDMRERFAEASGERVLDAGCGHGRDSEFFHEKGLNVTGIDISEELIDIARERSEANFEVMDSGT
jgi:2-polyprenyl-3-methyl-5-hydroxy-6-metoxy-1,4-benzoquinol methylase